MNGELGSGLPPGGLGGRTHTRTHASAVFTEEI